MSVTELPTNSEPETGKEIPVIVGGEMEIVETGLIHPAEILNWEPTWTLNTIPYLSVTKPAHWEEGELEELHICETIFEEQDLWGGATWGVVVRGESVRFMLAAVGGSSSRDISIATATLDLARHRSVAAEISRCNIVYLDDTLGTFRSYSGILFGGNWERQHARCRCLPIEGLMTLRDGLTAGPNDSHHTALTDELLTKRPVAKQVLTGDDESHRRQS